MATYDFTVRAQDETGAFSDRDFSIQVRNNLVDRILAIDSNNAYASVDGTTWTERTGKGGEWCRNLLGKWIVCTYAYSDGSTQVARCGRDYRLSEDTINWTENLQFRLSNDAPEYDEQGTEITPAGPLYNQYFYPTRDQFSVINGKIVTPAIVNDKLCIVYSTDAINWYAYESTKSSDASNMMGIAENALAIQGGSGYPLGYLQRHGISNIVLHNGKYTMINNATRNFYVSDDLIDWEIVTITNKSDLGVLNYTIDIDTSNNRYRDNIWQIISVNNVLWMMGQQNYEYDSSSSIQRRSYNYIFYTTNLTDISYSTNHYKYVGESYQTTSGSSIGRYMSAVYTTSSSTFYSGSPYNTEHRQIYYANGVIFAYCGKDIVTTKTLTNNTRQSTGNDSNYLKIISGSCFFEGDIYYAQIGTETGYGVKKLTIDSNEYRTSSDVTGLPATVTDITSV